MKSTQDVEEINFLLSATVRRGIAQLWRYSASHTTLELRIRMDSHEKNLHVLCKGCASIHGPTSWHVQNLVLSEGSESNPTAARYSLADNGIFRAECNTIAIAQDVPLMYSYIDEVDR